jgi:hypothetical protein
VDVDRKGRRSSPKIAHLCAIRENERSAGSEGSRSFTRGEMPTLKILTDGARSTQQRFGLI